MESQKELKMEKYLKETDLNLKARFFALYWGQHVLYFSSDFLRKIDNLTLDSIENDDFLELKPLSQISDEDVIECAKLIYGNYHIEQMFSILSKDKEIYEIRYSIEKEKHYLKFDNLRLKGYALPYMDLSVEDLIQYGWIKLKEN